MSIFEELFGPYPYAEYDVVSSPMQALGIEYPGVVGIFKDLYIENSPKYGSATRYILEMVVIHELAHQWFYNIIGNDQQSLPWVDESITQYSVYLYTKGVWGNDTAEMRVDEWRQRLAPLEDPELPLGMAVSEYGRAYSAIIYGRGPLFYYQLEKLLGEDILLAGLTDYSLKNRWGIATTESIQDTLEAACECDLSEAFAEWVTP
jgi:aminopeptidase N